ncbi:MAG: 2-C-methyl-D-erythritol 4-phosphate cytidylyltransferase [Candidatus Competibacteraceae bacterium]|nr:2-C-methyl-D-erythritol 4-phosphate cytidylyltransferase [Candidatus Competibacteraceae bacterium]
MTARAARPEPAYWALVPAAGAGRRMGSTVPKQYLPLRGRPVLAHTLTTLLHHPRIAGVAVAVDAADRRWPTIAAQLETEKPVLAVTGGVERCHSVLNGLDALRERAAPDAWVLVHDAARPCLTSADLDRLLRELADDPVGGLLAVPVRDTIKRAEADDRSAATLDRSRLWHALTPQMFRLEPLHAALQAALARGLLVTDEAAAMEAAGFAPRLIEGRADNLKITRPEDLALAAFFLARTSAPGAGSSDLDQ